MTNNRPLTSTEKKVIEAIRRHPGWTAHEIANKLGIGSQHASNLLHSLSSEQRGELRCLVVAWNRPFRFYLPKNAPEDAGFSKPRSNYGRLGSSTHASPPGPYSAVLLNNLLGYDRALGAARQIAERIPSSYERRI